MMLLYKNGRFHIGKASFALPDGFYLESDIELTEGSALCAWDPERKYLFRWQYFHDCEGSARELQKWFLPDSGLTPLSEVVPVSIYGLTGHMVLYRSYRPRYCEVRLDLGAGEELSLMVETREGRAEEIPASPAFRAAWEGLGPGECPKREEDGFGPKN